MKQNQGCNKLFNLVQALICAPSSVRRSFQRTAPSISPWSDHLLQQLNGEVEGGLVCDGVDQDDDVRPPHQHLQMPQLRLALQKQNEICKYLIPTEL